MSTHEGLSARLAYSPDGRSWHNASLLEELQRDPEGKAWSLWTWPSAVELSPPLQVTMSAPFSGDQAEDRKLQLENPLREALRRYAQERGWPHPRLAVTCLKSRPSECSYAIHLRGRLLAHVPIPSGKLLALADPDRLQDLLGLETLDPMMGLPAKWISRSQGPQAAQQGLFVLDEGALLATHTLHLLARRWFQALDAVALQRWLLPAHAAGHDLTPTPLGRSPGRLLWLLRHLLEDQLWLPPVTWLLPEIIDRLSPSDGASSDLEAVRRAVVPHNLERYLDRSGQLRAVEWVGPWSPEPFRAARLVRRLGWLVAEAEDDGAPLVVLTDAHHRLPVAQALKPAFPDLSVWSWNDLVEPIAIDLVARLDSQRDWEPPPWPGLGFQEAVSRGGA